MCDEHGLSLTSNQDPTRAVILKLKEELQIKTKAIENLGRNYRKIESEYSKLKNNYEGLLQENRMQVDDLNETSCEDKDNDNVSALITENQLLRELNTELKHTNLLLNEILTKEKERPNKYKETYADITSKKIHIPPSKKVPKIVVTRKDKEEKSVIKEKVFHYLLKEKSIQTKKLIRKVKM